MVRTIAIDDYQWKKLNDMKQPGDHMKDIINKLLKKAEENKRNESS